MSSCLTKYDTLFQTRRLTKYFQAISKIRVIVQVTVYKVPNLNFKYNFTKSPTVFHRNGRLSKLESIRRTNGGKSSGTELKNAHHR